MPTFGSARQVLTEAIARRVFPAASVEVGTVTRVLWREAVGRLTYEAAADATTPATVFDLASLTKVIATASLAMRFVDSGRIDLRAPVSQVLTRWSGPDREGVCLADLLAHTAGLPPHRPYYEVMAGREAIETAICQEPLGYLPRTASVYSDLGFLLLGFILEDVGRVGLDVQFDHLMADLWWHAAERDGSEREDGGRELCFRPGAAWRARTAPTRLDVALGRPRQGEVDDLNAAALGGVAAHAGLFGTAPAVGAFAREVLGTWLARPGFGVVARPETLQRFTRRTGVAGSSRALAWDTMLPTSSCGARMSPQAFGHTGFTGTSLWIDPGAGRYVVLLTNRVYPGADPASPITDVRRAFHDAVMAS
jgi:CubicO group peptidase (beta-lactamase class C family)